MKHLPDNSINQYEESNAIGKTEYLSSSSINQQAWRNAVEKMEYLTDNNINHNASSISIKEADIPIRQRHKSTNTE